MNANRIVSILGTVSALMLSGAAMADDNTGGMTTLDAPAGSLKTNEGALMCVAAVNSTGTLAGGSPYVSSSTNLGVGSYEVIFKNACAPNITAAKGWARWVQVDTLTTGSISGVSCTTADRAGNQKGVFVHCTDAAGAAVNTSFFLFVAR